MKTPESVSEYMAQIGAKGGRVMSPTRRQALLKNLAKTRTHKKARKNKSK